MEPGEILDSARNIERFDRVARRNFGLDNQPNSQRSAGAFEPYSTNHSAIQNHQPDLISDGRLLRRLADAVECIQRRMKCNQGAVDE